MKKLNNNEVNEVNGCYSAVKVKIPYKSMNKDDPRCIFDQAKIEFRFGGNKLQIGDDEFIYGRYGDSVLAYRCPKCDRLYYKFNDSQWFIEKIGNN